MLHFVQSQCEILAQHVMSAWHGRTMLKAHSVIARSIQQIICIPIKLYQYLISPLLIPCCRYYPSCSQYAESAIKQYGITKGLWMATKRVLRCSPWSRGGYDPVLPNNEKL